MMNNMSDNLTAVRSSFDSNWSEEERQKYERFLELLSLMFLLKREPFYLFAVVEPLLAYIVVLFNLMAIIVFIRKTNHNPLTILLIALAFTDLLACLLNQGLEPFAEVQYQKVVEITDIDVVTLPFPFCFVHYSLNLMCDCFRMCSVFITAIIGVQRIIAIQYPFWCRQYITKKTTIFIVILAITIAIIIQLPRHFGIRLRGKPQKDVCLVDTIHFPMIVYNLEYYPYILWSVFAVTFSILMFSTVRIIFYVYRKTSISSSQQTSLDLKKRRAAILVVAIVVIFILSEGPRTIFYTFTILNPITAKLEFDVPARFIMCDPLSFLYFSNSASPIESISLEDFRIYYQLMNIATVTGCAANFFVYVIMSEDMRRVLSRILCCWHNILNIQRPSSSDY